MAGDSPPVGTGQQTLGNDRLEIQRQVHQKLIPTLLREQIDDAVQGLVGAVGMQGRQAEMARLGEVDRMLHGLAIANLADQNHVRSLAQGIDQSGLPALRIHAHLALGDQAITVGVHVLHRILDGDDVPEAVLVAVSEHGRQGRGLPRARAPHDQDHAAFRHDEVFEDLGQTEIAQPRNTRRDGPQHSPGQPLLNEGIHPEAADSLRSDGKVDLLVGLVVPHLAVVHDGAHQHAGLAAGEDLIAQGRHASVDLASRRKVGGDEEVRALAGDHGPQAIEHEASGLLAVHDTLRCGFVKWLGPDSDRSVWAADLLRAKRQSPARGSSIVMFVKCRAFRSSADAACDTNRLSGKS